MGPESWLEERSSKVNWVSNPSCEGMVPEIMFPPSLSKVKEVRYPISEERVPCKSAEVKSMRVLVVLIAFPRRVIEGSGEESIVGS